MDKNIKVEVGDFVKMDMDYYLNPNSYSGDLKDYSEFFKGREDQYFEVTELCPDSSGYFRLEGFVYGNDNDNCMFKESTVLDKNKRVKATKIARKIYQNNIIREEGEYLYVKSDI